METTHTLLFVLQVLVAVALIGLILIQHGKGADAGAAFGSGSSATVFGSSGSASFLTKLTTGLVVVFLGNSLLLAYLATQNIQTTPTSLLDQPGIVLEQDAVEQDIPAVIEEQSEQLDSDLPNLPAQ
ncbi:MAG: protein-export membrane protein SecG [marine bacterium B5-7]|nr:MAG: protein-export membrane protein SecG [marine bacterium B5-7]